jgi:hypothetical protein
MYKMTDLDAERMFELLEYYAEGEGFRLWKVGQEFYDTFQNTSDGFRSTIWDVYRILREGPLKREVTAAMIMLDLDYGDEQPVYEYAARLQTVKKYVSPWRPNKRWRTGLHYLAIHYEMTAHIRDWATHHA